jgi:starch synthase
MPSRFEPCGQSQMIAMRYGTIPVVRSTGGLADTVVDADERPEAGNGFVFGPAEPAALAAAAARAIGAYRDAGRWATLVARAMQCDFSWARSAPRYVEAYGMATAIRERGVRRGAAPGRVGRSG